MKRLRRAAAACVLAALGWPAVAQHVVPATPAEPQSVQATAAALSDEAEAVKAALGQAQHDGAAIEEYALDGVRKFYAARKFELLWLRDGPATAQMKALRRRMQAADIYGLDPADYATPDLTAAYSAPAARAEAEIAFSRAVARFVTHLASGRVRPSEISRIITLAPERPQIGQALAQLASTDNVALALARHEPPHAQYRALKAELAELRTAAPEAERVVVPEGALLKPDKSDARVPALRTRLGLTPDPGAEPERYDDALVEALKAFQAAAGLTADGILGPRTLAALNGVSREEDIAAILANLERWRWMPRDLGAFHVMVNVPEFMVRVVDDGKMVHETRVVVGTPANATPTFSHVMDHLVVNPFWNVPASIVSNEMLPEIRRNPYGYFAKRGYQVLVRSGGRMRVVDPGRIDWWMVNPRSVAIRQVPGDHNALGRIKFMFPNQHSVYLHDTPSKKLFERDVRAFSHGCVRVDNPLEFADAILPVAAPKWNSERLEKLYGGPERRINLDKPIPVHLAYFTRFVDADGGLGRAEDLYGYDRRLSERTGV
jgi:murein L,D-transpeptidase YcbB/YkuD